MPDHDHIFETLPDGRRVCFECDVDEKMISAVLRHLGQRGGRMKSAAKTAACRRNGKLGGRPPKNPKPEVPASPA